MSDLKTALNTAADVYDPSKGWQTCAQPIPGLSYKDYHEIAEASVPVLRSHMKLFYERQRLSVVEITPEDLLAFEKSPLQFRTWLEKHCHETGKNNKADIMIVVGVKPLESCARKVAKNLDAADRERDYLRGMAVVLNPRGLTPARMADKLGSCISALESDEGNLARKNQFHTPNTTGYSGYKGINVVKVAADSDLSGVDFEILAEHKIELESHMDAHKLTRRLLNIDRTTESVLPDFYAVCGGQTDSDKRIAGTGLRKLDGKREFLTELSRVIYKTLRTSDGTARFLNPAEAHLHTSKDPKTLQAAIQSAQKAYGTRIADLIKESGIFNSLPKAQRVVLEPILATA